MFSLSVSWKKYAFLFLCAAACASPEKSYTEAEALVSKQQYKEAIQQFTAIQNEWPESQEAEKAKKSIIATRLKIAKRSIKARKFDVGIAQLRSLAKEWPESQEAKEASKIIVSAKLSVVQQLIAQKKYKVALKDLEELLSLTEKQESESAKEIQELLPKVLLQYANSTSNKSEKLSVLKRLQKRWPASKEAGKAKKLLNRLTCKDGRWSANINGRWIDGGKSEAKCNQSLRSIISMGAKFGMGTRGIPSKCECRQR